MQILVVLRPQYGQTIIVPVCEKAHVFAQIAGTKTLTKQTVDLIKRLGYTVVVAPTEPKEL